MPQGVNFTVQDNGLGLAPAGFGNTTCVIGCSSTGVPFVPIQSSNPATFVATAGYGPAPELSAYIANATGNTVIMVPVPSTTPGSNTAVTATRAGASTSVMTVSGTPLDSYYGKVTVLSTPTSPTSPVGTTGIVLGVSLDAGRTTYATANLLAATTFLIPNTGLTLNFAAGSLQVGDVFTWISFEPAWTDAAVTSAISSLLMVTTQPVDIFVTGVSASGDVAAFQTAVAQTLFNKKRFCRLLCNARDVLWGGTSTETEQQWLTSIAADFAATQADRVGVGAGHYNFISAVSQAQLRRPLLWGAAARDAGVAIQVDLGEVDIGSIPMVLPSTPDGFVYHDENVLSGADAARFMSMWSIAGLPGLYIMNPNLMAAPGSDFKWLQYGHVVDAACGIAYRFFVNRLSSPVRVDSTTGFILPQDAVTLETGCNRQLSTFLTDANAVSSAITAVSRTDNLLSTATLTVKISIVPLGYLKTINVTIQFVNPALAQVSLATGG